MDRRGFVRFWMAGLTLAVILGVIGPALADQKHQRPKHFRDHPFGGILGGQQGLVTFFIVNQEKLGLSDEQVTRLKAVRNGFRKVSARIGADLLEAEERLSDRMKADEMDIEEIETASKRIESLEHERRVEFAKAIAEGKRTLTSQQLQKAKELRKRPHIRKRSS